jgi:hypothetical protein
MTIYKQTSDAKRCSRYQPFKLNGRSLRMTESNWLFLGIYHIVVVYITDVDVATTKKLGFFHAFVFTN